MEKDRKLSKAEIKRKEEFEALSNRLALEGYTQKLLGISEAEMNSKIFFVALPVMMPFVILFFLLGNKWNLDILDYLISIGIYFALIVIHEALHGITWAFFAKDKWKSISFGVIRESFTPYCNCKEPLKKYQMVIGTLMPTIILGVGFGIAAVTSGSAMLLFLAVLNIMSGGGDLLIVSKLLTYKSDTESILLIDHPYEIGTAVFEKWG